MPVGWMKPPRGAILRVGHPMARGLEAAYLFNENSGATLFDYSRNGRNGTIVGATWVSTERGPALNFSGYGQYVLASGAWAAGLSQLSVTAIVADRLPGGAAFDTVFNLSEAVVSGVERFQFWCHRNDGGNWRLYAANTKIDVYGSATVSGWQTMSFVKGAATANIYRNGVSVGSDTSASGSLSASTVNMTLGAVYGTGVCYEGPFDIAAVFIHSRALDSAEIAQLHARPYDMFAR